VIGSAVYIGRWLKPARELVARLGPELGSRPVWIFSSGPVGNPPKPSDDPVDAATAVAATGAREHRVFAGHVNKDVLGFAERAMVRTFRTAVDDFRDWEEIRGWAGDIDAQLRTIPLVSARSSTATTSDPKTDPARIPAGRSNPT
jgi:menaquinone-dependent protoporphyrinogen oxidase